MRRSLTRPRPHRRTPTRLPHPQRSGGSTPSASVIGYPDEVVFSCLDETCYHNRCDPVDHSGPSGLGTAATRWRSPRRWETGPSILPRRLSVDVRTDAPEAAPQPGPLSPVGMVSLAGSQPLQARPSLCLPPGEDGPRRTVLRSIFPTVQFCSPISVRGTASLTGPFFLSTTARMTL